MHVGPPEDVSEFQNSPPRHGSAVTQALDVVTRAIDEMSARETRPLLDAPPSPYRLRPLDGSRFGFFPIVLSTAAFGSLDEEAAGRILGGYLAAGGNAVDVADGAPSLESVGAVLTGSGARDRVLISAEVGAHPGDEGLSAARLTAAVDRLLTALGTDRIEVLALADHDRATDVEETLTAADALIRAGKVRVLAAGAHGGHRLIEARVIAGQRALPFFAAVRPVYGLADRSEYETAVAPVVHAQGLGVFPRSPLPAGLLGAGDPRRRRRGSVPAGGRRDQRVIAALREIAKERSVAPASIALAWLATKPHVVAPIVAVGSRGELDAVLGATAVHLTRAEATALDRASA